MSSNNPIDLNYDYNYNMFIAKTLLPNLSSVKDREQAVKWMRKLSTSNSSVAEMKLRNDFIYSLVLNIQNNTLQEPYLNDPPMDTILNNSHLLVAAENSRSQIQGKIKYDANGKVKPNLPLKRERIPMGSLRPWQQQATTLATSSGLNSTNSSKPSTSKPKVKRKKKPASIQSRPVRQEVILEEFDVGGEASEEQAPVNIFQPSFTTPNSAYPSTCGDSPRPRTLM